MESQSFPYGERPFFFFSNFTANDLFGSFAEWSSLTSTLQFLGIDTILVQAESDDPDRFYSQVESILFDYLLDSSSRLVRLGVFLPFLVFGLFSYSPAEAKDTVRFKTTVGFFDVTLNPTENPNLQPFVDNFLRYVLEGRYDNTVINRAASNFVVQMGSFQANSLLTDSIPSDGFERIDTFDPVVVDHDRDGTADFNTVGLSNTRGEVAMALSSGNLNSGTSSFYVNLGNNNLLDPQGFIPFARIEDMTFIEEINNLERADLSSEAGQPGSLAYVDIPVVNGNAYVIIEQAVLIPEPSGVVLMAAIFALFAAKPRI